MKILFLYSEYVPYLDGLMRRLVVDHAATVRVVSWDKNLLKPPSIPQIPGVSFEKRSALTVAQLVNVIEGFKPRIIYISGWMDPGYLKAVKNARNRGEFTTVCGFDDNWFGTLRQRLGALYFHLFLRKFFDKAWVAGARQYHYARRFGYSDTDIAFNMLSCDTALFDAGITLDLDKDAKQRKFFYVGNFRDVKGTDHLADAYRIYRKDLRGSCELICIGQGPLHDLLDSVDGITVLPYMSSSELVQVTSAFDVFIFPSRKDQWGVALHEFALRGFPLLSSIGTGATERFLIDGFNGLMFDIGDHRDLAAKMKTFEEMPSDKLVLFGKRSRQIGQTISSELSAASLISLALN